MSSKFSNKYFIQEEFQKILNNFTKAIIFYKPKDIIDFAVNYFISLERKVPLDQILEQQKLKNIQKTDSTLNNEKNLSSEEKVNLEEAYNKDNLEESENEYSEVKIPMTDELKSFLQIKGINTDKIQDKEETDNSATDSDRKHVKNFIDDLFNN